MRSTGDANPLFLNAAAMAAMPLDAAKFINAIEQTFLMAATGKAVSTPKLGLHPDRGGLFHAMPAAIPGLAMVKWLTIGAQANGAIEATIIASDPESGKTIAVMDGNRITDLRTAAVSALAIKYLKTPTPGSTLGIVGCGRQAYAHIDLLRVVAPWIDKLILWSPRETSIAALTRYAEPDFVSIRRASSPQDLVESSDIVLSSTSYTSNSRRLLQAHWLKKSSLVLAVDLKSSWCFENEACFDLKVTDDREHSAQMIRSNILPNIGTFDTDLIQLIAAGKSLAPSAPGRVLFMPPGVSIADAGAVSYFLGLTATATTSDEEIDH